jgi:GTP-binding protein
MTELRNIAIIAHVDHGKTTLVDRILHQCQLFRENQETTAELLLDNNDLERERGITILSKNVSVRYKGVKINVIDTPGHSDFGGEVERVLNMADGVLLLVDAFEGAMPQTRFVLGKAIATGPEADRGHQQGGQAELHAGRGTRAGVRPHVHLGRHEDQLDFPVVYGSSKQGWMGPDWKTPTEDVSYLLDMILEHIPAPKKEDGTLADAHHLARLQQLPRPYRRGSRASRFHQAGQNVSLVKNDGTIKKGKVAELMVFEGLGKEKVKDRKLYSGELCAVMGLEGFDIGDTIADFENPEGCPTSRWTSPR